MSKIDLPRELPIDPRFERRVVCSLFRSHRWVPVAIAASLLIGFAAGLLQPRLASPKPEGREYILLLHGGGSGHVDEYRQWARQVRVAGGEKLKDETIVLGSPDASASVRGFFRIIARDRQAAEAVAKTCPHLKYGGWIELREIDQI